MENEYIDILNAIKKNKYYLDFEIVDIGKSTLGQAETCLLGIQKANIDTSEPLIITNCDQYTPWNSNKFLSFIRDNDPDGVVSTYNHSGIEVGSDSPYSHIELNDDGYATRLAEKVAISPLALNGIFYWKEGNHFIESAQQLMSDDTDAGWSTGKMSCVKEKYVSLTYNYLISEGKRFMNYHMADDEFVSLGSPNDIMLQIKRQNVMQAVEDLRNGKPIVMVDDYDREFEGDIVLAAEKATAENLLFAMRHARGLMCLFAHRKNWISLVFL